MFGIASALFELGGLIVIHDASGCNSTYTTHNEPRWYDTPSMVYISGLREVDTIHGNDERLIRDITEAASALHPAFIAVGGSPMPNVIGADFHAIAYLLEEKTGIPSMGFRTDGIHSYIPGAGTALQQLAERFVRDPSSERAPAGSRPPDAASPGQRGAANGCRDLAENKARPLRVNLLGVTPLDFSVTGNVTALKQLIADAGMELASCWAMGSTLDEIAGSACADVNAVVSAAGLQTAQYMKKRFGIPFVAGLPIGEKGTQDWIRALKEADTGYLTGMTGQEKMQHADTAFGSLNAWKYDPDAQIPDSEILVIGEPVFLHAMKRYLTAERGICSVRLLCPIADAPKALLDGIEMVSVEEAIRAECRHASRVIADPIYARLLPDKPEKFISLPHEAYSGRHYRDQIPVFIGEGILAWADKRGL